jgi:hypothetical protein
MKRTKLAIGDIFEVPLEVNSKGYFQFIGIDDSQLRSDVIRVFSKRYANSEEPELEVILQDDVDFYAHCVIKTGIKHDFWQKVGHKDDIGPADIMFRSSLDFGRSWIEISDRWEVWKISQPRKFVGKLPNSLLSTEFGTVFPPYEIIHRMKFGHYQQEFQR